MYFIEKGGWVNHGWSTTVFILGGPPLPDLAATRRSKNWSALLCHYPQWFILNPIWTYLNLSEIWSFYGFFRQKSEINLKSIWKSNLKSEESIWTNLNQSEPIWNLYCFLTTSKYHRRHSQTENSRKSEEIWMWRQTLYCLRAPQNGFFVFRMILASSINYQHEWFHVFN